MVAEEALHHKAYHQTIRALSARSQQLKLEMCLLLGTSRQMLGFMLDHAKININDHKYIYKILIEENIFCKLKKRIHFYKIIKKK